MKPEWHYIRDKLPPPPKKDGYIIIPLTYLCAYKLKDGGREVGDFLYLGDGEFMGMNTDYPIYAWLDCPIDIPSPID